MGCPLQLLGCGQTHFEPLGLQTTNLTLRHIQPRGMSGRVVEGHPREKLISFLLTPDLTQTFLGMGVEVVQYQVDMGSSVVFLYAVLPKEGGCVGGVTVIGDGYAPRAPKGSHGYEQITRAISFVFIVQPTNFARRARFATPGRVQELLTHFIKTVQLVAVWQWFSIQRQDIIHSLSKEPADLWNAPHFFPAMA